MKYTIFLVFTFIFFAFAASVFAVPTLQLYIEGGVYDLTTETWITDQFNFTLWVIGANDPISSVKFDLAVPTGQVATLSISAPDGDELTYLGTNANGTPTMGNGSSLPSHGIYSTQYFEYDIGSFDTSELVQDMVSPGSFKQGEVKRYNISISGVDWWHADAYNHVVLAHNRARYEKAPFSHDAGGEPEDTINIVPEPNTLLLISAGLVGLAGYSGIRFGRKKKVS